MDARSNDYLGLAGRSVSRETASEAPGESALGAGASRLVSGTAVEHVELERELAEWLGAEAALLFTSAYAANVGVLAALGERGDVILSDALNHASIIDGCRLSRAEVVVYPHRDADAVRARLRERGDSAGQAWVVTESYFGMDGDSPDLAALRAVCDEQGAGLIVDEAHALGVFGAEGRGLCAAAGIVPDALVGGFGKAFGAQGGFVAASRVFVEWFWNRARTFVFSTGSSPALARAARHRLALVRAGAGARSALRRLEARFAGRLAEGRVPLPEGRHGPVFPIVLGSEASALRVAQGLRDEGFWVQAIRPPTVPAGTSRLRVIVRADMSDEDTDALAAGLASALRREDPAAPEGAAPKGGTLATGSTGPSGEPRVSPTRAPAERSVVFGTGTGAGETHGVASGGRPEARAARAARAPGPGPAECWVVLGTGTGVGKTHVASGLAKVWARRGRCVAGLKPIETGVDSGRIGASDAAALERASFHVKHPNPHPLYSFRDPVTPSLAARRAGTAIDPRSVRDWLAQTRARAAPDSPVLVVETAGGVFSPLGPDLDNYRLALELDPARWVLVAMDRLGVLHEVASTLCAMSALGRGPDCLVLNAPAQADASTGTNLAELREMGVTVPIVQLGRDEHEPLDQLLALASPTPVDR